MRGSVARRHGDSVPVEGMEGVAGEVRSLVVALDAEELREWMGSLTERFIEENEGLFRWLLIFSIGGLAVRFVVEGLGLWRWA